MIKGDKLISICTLFGIEIAEQVENNQECMIKLKEIAQKHYDFKLTDFDALSEFHKVINEIKEKEWLKLK